MVDRPAEGAKSESRLLALTGVVLGIILVAGTKAPPPTPIVRTPIEITWQ